MTEAGITTCPCCGGALGEVAYRTGPVPVHTCLMLESAAQAEAFAKAPVALAGCAGCGFILNTQFDPKWSAYAPNYEDQQSFSPTFNSFAGTLAEDSVARLGLKGGHVVEIGCSKGDFLALLIGAGMAGGIGIDPSALPGRVPETLRDRLRLIPDYYAPAHLDLPTDLICCRHTLEHIQPVHEMLILMHRHAARNPGCKLLIEVPNAARIWRDGAFEDVYYEHCSYFSAGSLARAVRRAGFAVTRLEEEFDGQYLVLEGSLAPEDNRCFAIEADAAEDMTVLAQFASTVTGTAQAWKTRIAEETARGHRVAIWGSGSKCVAFLKALECEGQVAAIVDINPHRHGKYAPGLSTAISPPDALQQAMVDVVIVMNPVYKEEIGRACAQMGLHPEILSLEGG